MWVATTVAPCPAATRRYSGSAKPEWRTIWPFTSSSLPNGSGRSDLARTSTRSTLTVTSPVRVRNNGPWTPMMSPRSRCASTEYILSPSWSFLK